MPGRVVVAAVRPTTPSGQFPAKAVVGRPVRVTADVFADGHDVLGARVRWRATAESKWQEAPLRHVGNDRWEGELRADHLGRHEFVVEGWVDRLATWRRDVAVKLAAAQDVSVELEEGARLLEGVHRKLGREDRVLVREAADRLRDDALEPRERAASALDARLASMVGALPDRAGTTRAGPFPLWVDRERAAYGAWYELFPRSHGGLRGTIDRLPAIAAMGFDVVYLPPIHPIGRTARKGRNNTVEAAYDDVGSPWAIGAAEGGHTAIEPGLGTFDDFDALVTAAHHNGMEIALDYALQCSPDHPWVSEHPEWFHQRPDGSIKYAENPPKKYQDIYPINFFPDEPADREALWGACKAILDFWIGRGVRIFRVDNPHTKPFDFWAWLIPAVQAEHPEIVFLAEAFSRPAIMGRLAEIGFSQSYTYFTWRTTKGELRDYGNELAAGRGADFFRPNFWPNTPDILAGPLRGGHLGVFKQRAVLAATMSPSWGLYSGYELGENEPFSPANEEYMHSEKYEVKSRDWDDPASIASYIARLNAARRAHPALHELTNLRFHHSGNDQLLAYSKRAGDDVVLVVVNLDPNAAQEDTLWLDLDALGFGWDEPFDAHDELDGRVYRWQGASPYVRLTPDEPAHVLHLRPIGL